MRGKLTVYFNKRVAEKPEQIHADRRIVDIGFTLAVLCQCAAQNQGCIGLQIVFFEHLIRGVRLRNVKLGRHRQAVLSVAH